MWKVLMGITAGCMYNRHGDNDKLPAEKTEFKKICKGTKDQLPGG